MLAEGGIAPGTGIKKKLYVLNEMHVNLKSGDPKNHTK